MFSCRVNIDSWVVIKFSTIKKLCEVTMKIPSAGAPADRLISLKMCLMTRFPEKSEFLSFVTGNMGNVLSFDKK